MKRTRICAIFLLCATFLSLFSAVSAFADTQKEIKDGIFTYTISNGKATIIDVEDTQKKVEIPAKFDDCPVVALASGACGGNAVMEEIIIPDSITSIGSMCFSYCTSLTSVQLPKKLTSIETGAFHHCTSLRSITLPDTIKTIEKDAFYRCDELWTISIPESVNTIGENAFADCKNLSAAVIPTTVNKIEKNAFEAHDGFRIYAKPGTQAETFAQKQSVTFEELITISVNGQSVVFDQPPITNLENYRTLVPMRAILTPLGANITWDNYFNMAGIDLFENRLLVRIGEPFMMLNGSAYPLSVPAIEFNNRTMLPVRDIVESVGGTVEWDEKAKHITITCKTEITD